MTSCLQEMCRTSGYKLDMDCIDIKRKPRVDLSYSKQRKKILKKMKAGAYDAILLSPPCSTFTRAVWANFNGCSRPSTELAGLAYMLKNPSQEARPCAQAVAPSAMGAMRDTWDFVLEDDKTLKGLMRVKTHEAVLTMLRASGAKHPCQQQRWIIEPITPPPSELPGRVVACRQRAHGNRLRRCHGRPPGMRFWRHPS